MAQSADWRTTDNEHWPKHVRTKRTNNDDDGENGEKQIQNPVLSDRDTDLTKIKPRMWWEQISEYIDLTYHKNLEDLMDQGTEAMDAHVTYHIKSAAFGPWGRTLNTR